MNILLKIKQLTKEKKRDIIKEKEETKGGDIYNEKDNRSKI